MAVPVEEQVFRLQVSIDDVQRMQIVQSKGDLGCVEFGDWIGEALCEEQVSQSCKHRETRCRIQT